jgi:hypothetical protein
MNTGGTHNVVFTDNTFTQPAMALPAASWPAVVSRTFPMAGTFTYYCELHRSVGMTGVVNVLAAGGQPPPPGGTPPPPPPGGTPAPPGGSPKLTPFKVTLRLSDSTPGRSAKVRFFGTVRPAQDGRLALIQVRSRGGRYKTIAKTRLRDAGKKQSAFSVRLRVAHAGAFRVRVLGSGSHSTGTSGTRRIKPA